ncbi:adenylate kinase [Spirochaeta lutea]|uniref:Adenylate kinase n=1 Tax=Spirochaeta lutea TaxID=1480694 RepID=A0A098QTL2_9SPIO|nr:adenylate kinase [Spirochaeta lutea]KGE71074.1 adenylate kinase [Spirochaeta lutea]
MRLIFLGPPGAGKGTMASRLAHELTIPHISTGDIIRAAIQNGTELGLKVKRIVESGDLVPDDLTITLVQNRLAEKDADRGFILDGFPRTIPQAEALSQFSSVDKVINFDLEEDEIIKRLSGRRVHKASGRTYHVIYNPPKVDGKDDVTGEELSIRPDDQVDAIKNRLAVYEKQTAPLIKYYSDRNLLANLDARPAPDAVFQALTAITS